MPLYVRIDDRYWRWQLQRPADAGRAAGAPFPERRRTDRRAHLDPSARIRQFRRAAPVVRCALDAANARKFGVQRGASGADPAHAAMPRRSSFFGVTGSGKSTSLQVALSLLLQRHEGRINLMTIEQPLEYVIPGAVQTPLLCDLDDPRAVSEAWSRAISNLMRLDPDVMMVGELRDLPSAVAAIQAALTGHGLWTTTHAKGAFASLDRLADLGVAPRRLGDASLFTGLINQPLAPTLCSACKRPCAEHIHEIEDDLRARIEAFTNVKKVYLRGTRPDCPACGGMGVTGRTVVAEIVLTAQPLMDIYRAEAGGSAAAKSYWVKQMKGITKCRHLIEKINQGWIDPKMGEEAVCSLAEDTFTLQ